MNIITEPISHLNIIPPIDNRNELNYNPERVYNSVLAGFLDHIEVPEYLLPDLAPVFFDEDQYL